MRNYFHMSLETLITTLVRDGNGLVTKRNEQFIFKKEQFSHKWH